MRLHRLELQAFGPFAGEVAIDLDALSADGLFLLHGETGAGKTTLLDAVAFALYGRVPGARGEAKQLRCDRADPATATVVRLELTLGGRRAVITRSPEYQRRKARGSGTTTQKAAVTLRWVGTSADGAPGADLTRADEVGQVVLDQLGMSADQFFQVVLLPQGEFARFLRADTAEREVLLEKLFDTGRFATIESWFAQARRQARAAADEAESAVAQELARVTEAAGIPADLAVGFTEPLAADDETAHAQPIGGDACAVAQEVTGHAAPATVLAPPTFDVAWLARLQDDLAVQATRADGLAQAGRAARETATAELVAGERRDAAVVKMIELRSEQAEVDAGEPEHRAVVAAVAAAERAAPVVVAATVVVAARATQASAEQAVSLAREAVPAESRPELGRIGTHELDLDCGLFSVEEDGSPHVPESDSKALRGAADEARDQAGALGALIGLADEQDRDTVQRSRVQDELQRAEGERAEVETEWETTPRRRLAVEQELQNVRQRADRLVDCERAVTSATEIRDAAASTVTLQSQLEAAEEACRAAIDAHQQARDERQLLVDRRIAGMAAELAGQLRNGEPCVVCGSVSHPAPAVVDGDYVDGDAIAAALRREQQIEAARAQSESVVAAARTELTTAATSARGLDLAPSQVLLDESLTALSAAREAADHLPAVAADLQAVVERQTVLAACRTELLERIQGLRTTLAGLDAALVTRSDRLVEAAGGFTSVMARRDHLIAVAAGLDEWAAAAEASIRAEVQVRIATQVRDKAVADAGFADLSAALAAAELDLPRANDAVRHYQERALVVSTRLADPELRLADSLERVDLTILRSRAKDAEATAESTAALSHHAYQRCRQVEAAAARLEHAWRVHAPLAQAASSMTALAEVVAGRGQNSRALSLRSYVLAAKLQQVAAVASQRLSQMSSGRYTFVHSDQREARGKSGGLGLDILDAYSGLVRQAKTLSGGESFLASLALALGLADVVAAESGGRMLDTIFIDEGFGSLDADTLDLVMTTLDELRAGGRVVGVVSHVDEMRQRIPSRLHVRKNANGSSVEMSGW